MREPMSDLDRLVERLGRSRLFGYMPFATREAIRDAQDALRLQDATITRLREALAQAEAFVSDEADNRSAAGSEYSDYETEARDVLDAIRQALGGEHG